MNGEDYLSDLQNELSRQRHVVYALEKEIEGNYESLKQHKRLNCVDFARHTEKNIRAREKQLRTEMRKCCEIEKMIQEFNAHYEG